MPTTKRILELLVRQAKAGAKWRGHTMTNFAYLHPSADRVTGWSTCKVCQAYMSVDTRPDPNGIDIGGNAVSLNCPVSADS